MKLRVDTQGATVSIASGMGTWKTPIAIKRATPWSVMARRVDLAAQSSNSSHGIGEYRLIVIDVTQTFNTGSSDITTVENLSGGPRAIGTSFANYPWLAALKLAATDTVNAADIVSILKYGSIAPQGVEIDVTPLEPDDWKLSEEGIWVDVQCRFPEAQAVTAGITVES